MFSVTGRLWLDMTLLGLFQIGLIVAIATGWMLQFPGRRQSIARPVKPSVPRGRGDRIALAAGIVLGLAALAFFIWRYAGEMRRERAVVPLALNASVQSRESPQLHAAQFSRHNR
jgi:hypothetical protein